MKDKSEKFRIELAFLRDNLITAIRDQKTGSLDDLLDLYRALVETFVKKLKQLGADYDMATTFKETQSFGQEWPEIRWLDDDVRAMIDEAFSLGNQNILRKIIYFPISLAHIALIEKDYFTYSHSLQWIPYLVKRASKLPDVETKKAAIDLISLHLKELGDFYIGHLIKTSQDEDEIRRLKELAAGLVLTFNRLLKSAYDSRDYESFKMFLSRLNALFEYIFRDSTAYEMKAHQLARKTASKSVENEKLEKEILIATAIFDAGEDTDALRNQLRFGLQSWIVNEYETKKLSPEQLVPYYRELNSYGDMKGLTITYFSCIERTTSDIFGWTFWELEELEGGVGWLNIDMHHSKLYCLKALELLKEVKIDQVVRYEIPERHSIIFRSEEVVKISLEIEQNHAFWAPLIGSAAINAAPIFREMLKRAVERQKDKELNRLIDADLDPDYIKKFQKDFIKGWKEHATVRAIVKQFRRYSEAGPAPDSALFFGINVSDRKDVYVKDTDLYNKDWGIEYGRNLGSSENSYITDLILKKVSTFTQKIEKKEKLELVDEALEELRNKGYVPNVIMLFNAWSVKDLMMSSGTWKTLEVTTIPRGQLQGGYYKNIFVCDLHGRGERGIAFIADLNRFGIWKQFEPRQLIPGEERLDVFSFLLKKYDQERAEQLLAQNPEWLKDPQTGQQRPREEALREIYQRVHLRVVEQYEFLIEDPNAGLKVNLGKDW